MQNNLTLRELMVLRALANGAQSKEIADHINRSRGTVEFYIRGLFAKLNARSRPHLVAQAFRIGLLNVDHDPGPAAGGQRGRRPVLKRVARAAPGTRISVFQLRDRSSADGPGGNALATGFSASKEAVELDSLRADRARRYE
jgi:DNA-binding CsgD family transcriptional regulator